MLQLRMVGVRVKPVTMNGRIQMPLTGDAADHLLKEEAIKVLWIWLPEWLQPYIKWIWIVLRKLLMWISALWLPDNIMKGFHTKALLWGERLVLIWGTKAHSPTTHNLIEHICCMLPCGMYSVQGLEYLHQLQREIVKYTMCGGGTATTQ